MRLRTMCLSGAPVQWCRLKALPSADTGTCL